MNDWLKFLLLTLVFYVPFSSGHDTGEPHIEIHSVQQHPAIVTADQEFEIHVSGYNVGFEGSEIFTVPSSLSVQVDGNKVLLQALGSVCFQPHPPLPANDRPQSRRYRVPGLPEGTYTIEFTIHQCSSAPVVGQATVIVYPVLEPLDYFQESPRAGQVVSGVGVVRGWACYTKLEGDLFPDSDGGNIGRVTYQVDSRPVIEIPYGSSRTDTSEICGRENTRTGYGAVTYWGIYGTGEHTFTLYVDGKAVESFEFSVAAQPGGFQKGLEGEYELSDFPTPGESVRVKWSQADQNFIIVEFD